MATGTVVDSADRPVDDALVARVDGASGQAGQLRGAARLASSAGPATVGASRVAAAARASSSSGPPARTGVASGAARARAVASGSPDFGVLTPVSGAGAIPLPARAAGSIAVPHGAGVLGPTWPAVDASTVAVDASTVAVDAGGSNGVEGHAVIRAVEARGFVIREPVAAPAAVGVPRAGAVLAGPGELVDSTTASVDDGAVPCDDGMEERRPLAYGALR